MKKVLYITYYWPPSGGAGVQRSLKFVKYLQDFGIEAIVLTVNSGKASYPIIDDTLLEDVPKSLKVFSTDSFEPLSIFSKLRGKKKIPYGGFANSGKETQIDKFFKFVRGNFFIPDARRGWVKYAVKEAVEIIKREDISTIIISSPPHSSQLIGLKLKKILPHCSWIADLRDPWTDIFYYHQLSHTELAKKKDIAYEREVLEKSDAAVVVSEDIKRLFLKKSNKIREEKIFVIPNGFDPSDFDHKNDPSKEVFIIGYVGTIAENYHPEILFSAISSIRRKFPTLKIKLRFVGSATSHLMELAALYDLTNSLELISHVSHAEALKFMQSSSMLLLLIPNVENNKGILTGKLFEYIGAGRPIIGIGPVDGDAGMILKQEDCGKMFDHHSEKELEEYLIDSILRWEKDHRFGYTTSVNSKFTRKNLTADLAKLINKV